VSIEKKDPIANVQVETNSSGAKQDEVRSHGVFV